MCGIYVKQHANIRAVTKSTNHSATLYKLIEKIHMSTQYSKKPLQPDDKGKILQLLNDGADPNYVPRSKISQYGKLRLSYFQLTKAIEIGDLEIIRSLLEHGADVIHRHPYIFLELAIESIPITTLLLEYIPLTPTLIEKHLEKVAGVVPHELWGSSCPARDQEGRLIRYLLTRPEYHDQYQYAFNNAIKQNQVPLVEYLLKEYRDVKLEEDQRFPDKALKMYRLLDQHWDRSQARSVRGFDVSKMISQIETEKDFEFFKKLLNGDREPRACDRDDLDQLFLKAIRSGKFTVAKYLLDQGADITAKDPRKYLLGGQDDMVNLIPQDQLTEGLKFIQDNAPTQEICQEFTQRLIPRWT